MQKIKEIMKFLLTPSLMDYDGLVNFFLPIFSLTYLPWFP